MFAHEFVRNAYLAGTFIALACGVIGWLVVLRGQVFAGDARVGLFALTIVVAAGMAALGPRAQADDTVIGTVYAWILGVGLLFIALLATSSAGGTGTALPNTLFGSIYDLTGAAARLAAVVALATAIAVVAAFRPLLFSTLDPELASVRGVPVRLLGTGFLLLLAVVTAQSTQAVGALLLLGLLAAPAGAAHKLTVRPYAGLALSGALAVGAMWGGLALSYAISSLPPSSAIIGLAAGTYAAASALPRAGRSRAVQSRLTRSHAVQSGLAQRPAGGAGRESEPGPPPYL